MKNIPDHLPQSKQHELSQIVDIVLEKCDDIELVILFGSYARGDFREGAVRENGSSALTHNSDYDLLVVVNAKAVARNHGIWQDAEKKCLEQNMSTHPRIIAHDADDLNARLAEGHYFFTDIKKEGCRLYDTGNITLVEPRILSPAERHRIAQSHYDYWFTQATDFFETYEFHYSKKKWNLAAFDLHQASESAYKSVLLVFTNYCPKEHHLHILGGKASEHDPELADIFPQTTLAERRRLESLNYAYIGARYDPDYNISQQELDHLIAPVKQLLDRTEIICTGKLADFK